MGMVMRMCCTQSQTMEISGGATESIFPLVEKWLDQEDNVKALRHISGKPGKYGYHSVIDWLTCETFPEEKPRCKAFYKNQGPLLRELISDARREFYERVMLFVLMTAHKAFQEKQQTEWMALAQTARALEQLMQ